MTTGRPKSEIDERLPEGWQDRFYELASEGASDVELRAEYKISHSLWYRWLEEEPIFSQTVKECHDLCQIWWEKAGRGMVMGADGNATCWIFNMKNRFGWKDKTETEVTATVSQSTTLSIDKTTLDDIIAKL